MLQSRTPISRRAFRKTFDSSLIRTLAFVNLMLALSMKETRDLSFQ